MEFISELVKLIKLSPKRLSFFETTRKEITFASDESQLSYPALRILCPTRWTVWHSAINSIIENYQALKSTLEVVEQGHDDHAAKAEGLLIKMETFELFFSLKLAYRIFSAAEQLSINLQAKDTTVSEGITGAHLLKLHFTSMRSDASFARFYHETLTSSSDLTGEPVLSRRRKAPKHLDGGANPHHHACPEDKYRQQYFDVLDHVVREIDKRFHQNDIAFVNEVESLLLDAANGKGQPEISDAVSKYSKGKIDLPRLKTQLMMLPDALHTVFSGSTIQLKKVTNVRTIADAFNRNEMVKRMFSEVDKLLRAYLAFLVTSATAARSFSSLRRIKTFLRSSMTSKCLNNLFLLHVHTAQTDSLDLVSVTREFVSSNARRLNYFGKF